MSDKGLKKLLFESLLRGDYVRSSLAVTYHEKDLTITHLTFSHLKYGIMEQDLGKPHG